MTSLPSSPETTIQRVISAVAAKEAVDPLDLDRPLYDAIDPDALTSLFQCSQSDVEVTFGYLDYQVTAHSNGMIEVTEADE